MLCRYVLFFIAAIKTALAQTVSETYTPLKVGQEFYVNGVVKDFEPPSSQRYAFGGWVKVGDSTKAGLFGNYAILGIWNLSVNNFPLVSLTGQSNSFAYFNPKEWIFFAFLRAVNGSNTRTCLDFSGAQKTFATVTEEAFLVSRSTNNTTSMAGSTWASTILMANGQLNATGLFMPRNESDLTYANLFYAFAPDMSTMLNRIASYMVGPYNGDIRLFRGQKWNVAIDSYTLTSLSTQLVIGTGSAIMKALIDGNGAYLPQNTSLTLAKFFFASSASPTARTDLPTSRTLEYRLRFWLRASNATLQENATYHIVTARMFPTSVPLQNNKFDLTVHFQRTTGLCLMYLKTTPANGTAKTIALNLTTDLDFLSPTKLHMLTVKLTIIRFENSTEYNASSPLVNFVLDVSMRFTKTVEVYKYKTYLVGPMKLPFDVDSECSLEFSHSHDNANNQSFVYLEMVSLQHGGMSLHESGVSSSLIPSCLAPSVILAPNVIPYCQECYPGMLTTPTGSCGFPSGGNASCNSWYSQSECLYCIGGYYMSLTQSECINAITICPNSTHDSETRPNIYALSDTRCSDRKFYDSANECYYFSKAVAGQNRCVCKVANCDKCAHTPCDKCATGFFLLVVGRERTCASSAPALYGKVPGAFIPSLRFCLGGSGSCSSADYAYIPACPTLTTYDQSRRMCIECSARLGRYWDASSPSSCKSCLLPCTSCIGTNTNCLTCALGDSSTMFLLQENSSCVSCGTSQTYSLNASVSVSVFQDTTNPFKPLCQLCHTSCLTCNATGPLGCILCKATLYKYPNSTCGLCPGPRFFKSGNSCLECHPSCLTCSNSSATGCLTCNISHSTYKYLYPNYACDDCTDLHYYISSTKCKKCSSTCLTCSSSTINSCLSCNTSRLGFQYLYPSNNTCGSCNHTTGFFIDNDYCRLCHPTCATCDGSLETDCLTCDRSSLETGFLYPNSTCGKCNEDKMFRSGLSCQPCDPTCLRCSAFSPNSCTSCDDSTPEFKFLYLDGTCGPCIGDGVYQAFDSVSGNICRPCDSICKTCSASGTDQCLSCYPGQNPYLHNNRTCGPCSNGDKYFITTDLTRCLPCFSGCKQCLSTKVSGCVSCIDDFLFDPTGVCVNCKRTGYFEKAGSCFQCSSKCENCSLSSTNCISCKTSLFLNLSSNTCTACTAPRLYRNMTDITCRSCHWRCNQCSGPASTDCTKCDSTAGLYLHANGTCESCKGISGYFGSAESRCLPCAPNCLGCTGATSTECTLCVPHARLAGTQCLWTALTLTSSSFDKYNSSVTWTFSADLAVTTETLNDLVEVAVFEFPQNSIQEVISRVQFNQSLLEVPGLITSPATVQSLSINGRTINGKVIAPHPSNIDRAVAILRFKQQYGLTSATDYAVSFTGNAVYVEGISITTTSMDSAMDNASGTVSLLVTILMLPQAFILLRIFNSLDLYVFIDVVYPTLFEKVLEMFSVSIGDYVPNIFIYFADDEGEEVHPRLKHFGFEVHFLKNLGSLFTLMTGLGIIWLITLPFNKSSRNIFSRTISRLHSLLNAEFWINLIESSHTEIVLSILVFLASRESVNEWYPMRYTMVCILSLISLGLISFYGYLVWTIRRLIQSYYTHAIIEVAHMHDEPLRHLLSDKVVSGNWFQKYFAVILFVREALMCFVVYFLIRRPQIVTIIISLAQLVFTIGVLTSAPYTTKRANWLLWITHSLYLMLNLCLMYLAQTKIDSSKYSQSHFILGIVMIGIMAGLVFSNIGFTLYYTAVELYNRWKQRRLKFLKSQVRPVEREDSSPELNETRQNVTSPNASPRAKASASKRRIVSDASQFSLNTSVVQPLRGTSLLNDTKVSTAPAPVTGKTPSIMRNKSKKMLKSKDASNKVFSKNALKRPEVDKTLPDSSN